MTEFTLEENHKINLHLFQDSHLKSLMSILETQDYFGIELIIKTYLKSI